MKKFLTNVKALAIIPARGGSKGIKKKNLKKLDGKPLIFYTIESAKKSKKFDRIIVSTDNKEIAKISIAMAFPIFESSFGPALAISNFAPEELKKRVLIYTY